MYEGGALYWDESDTNSETLIYNAGRISNIARTIVDDNGDDDWLRIYNSTVWLVSILFISDST